jgi:hypothetical protein
MTAQAEMQIYLIGLPPILPPEAESEEYDLEEMPPQLERETVPA